ncbi:MAG: hypothetical protein WCF24_05965 [Acidimicrobiales bacterium]
MGRITSRIGSAVTGALAERFSDLFRRYVLEEALKPLRHLGRRLAFGVLGAILIGIGSVAALVGVLRVLQTETGSAFAGTWSFAPYLLTAATGLAALGGFVVFGFRGLLTRGSARGSRARRRS